MTDEGQAAIEAATDQLVVRLETLFQWELNREHGRTFTRHIIRAYLAELPKPEAMTLGSGLALRPYHPSEEMRKAGEEAWREFHTFKTGGWFAIWQAMFRAYDARPPGLED